MEPDFKKLPTKITREDSLKNYYLTHEAHEQHAGQKIFSTNHTCPSYHHKNKTLARQFK